MGLFGERRNFMGRLGSADRATLADTGTRHEYPPQHTILSEGDPTTFAVVILQGRCTVWSTTERGGRLILGLRQAGEVVGDMAALDGRPRSASVSTLPESGVGDAAGQAPVAEHPRRSTAGCGVRWRCWDWRWCW